jgi:alanine-glyoxylate transaminase / (R)-3-amino-2-methylpropionate-pyruvate transaminase
MWKSGAGQVGAARAGRNTSAAPEKQHQGVQQVTTIAPRLDMPPVNHTPRPYTGPTREAILEMRRQYTNPAIFTTYHDPLLIVEGFMQYLYDETGRRYLDMFAGIVTVSVGHSHPEFVRRVQEQVGTLQHATTMYLHPNFALLAKKLASKMPPGLDVTYFVNDGTEANELAITMARLFTGNTDIIAVRNGYHGGSPTGQGLTSHSTWKFPVSGEGHVHHAMNPHPYRSPFQGVGGATHGAPNYLKEAYAIVREAGGLCIADEVQTGFGRTGDHYWGFQNFGVVPDFVTMAKGLGNGAPIGAVTTRMDIARTLSQRIHFNTFGGNPVSMAAGLAAMDIIDEDGLQENSRVLGARLKKGLERLQKSHELIGDVRGMGLMLGVELVRDRGTKEPARAETVDILEATRELGVLIGKGGLDGNTLRIKPPMCITADDVDFALEVFDQAFAKVEGK